MALKAAVGHGHLGHAALALETCLPLLGLLLFVLIIQHDHQDDQRHHGHQDQEQDPGIVKALRLMDIDIDLITGLLGLLLHHISDLHRDAPLQRVLLHGIVGQIGTGDLIDAVFHRVGQGQGDPGLVLFIIGHAGDPYLLALQQDLVVRRSGQPSHRLAEGEADLPVSHGLRADQIRRFMVRDPVDVHHCFGQNAVVGELEAEILFFIGDHIAGRPVLDADIVLKPLRDLRQHEAAFLRLEGPKEAAGGPGELAEAVDVLLGRPLDAHGIGREALVLQGGQGFLGLLLPGGKILAVGHHEEYLPAAGPSGLIGQGGYPVDPLKEQGLLVLILKPLQYPGHIRRGLAAVRHQGHFIAKGTQDQLVLFSQTVLQR